MKPLRLLAAALLFAACLLPAADALRLPARQRVESAPGSGEWRVAERVLEWDAARTAVILCDLWDTHTCPAAASRVAEMAPRVEAFVKAARSRGALIIHCPSDTMKFYEGTPGRLLAQSAPVAAAKVPLQRWCRLDPAKEPPLPIDDTDGGCDGPRAWREGQPYPWTRQHPAIPIEEGDAVTDGAEAYHLLRQRGIAHVLVCGVHLNMCVLGRPFGIRQLAAQGLEVALVRDLTDTMYNPERRPWVNHFAGTELMVAHVEKHWCPTVTSAALLGGEAFRFKADVRPQVLFLIGDEEYRTGETVPAWAEKELPWRGIECRYVLEGPQGKGFPGLAALPNADALFISIKRRALPAAQMELIRRHIAAGKPVLGIRTASHAFGAKKAGEGEVVWEAFDREVLGGHYQNHYGKGAVTQVRAAAGAAGHPLLAGTGTNVLRFTSHLYKCRDLAPGVTALWTGGVEGSPEIAEPAAWIHERDGRRTFYTSLGAPEDFREPAFQRLLLNSVLWALRQRIPPAP